MTVRWFREVGILDRIWKLWVSQRPVCEDKLKEFVSVGRMELYPAMQVFRIGAGVSVAVLMAELIHFHRPQRTPREILKLRLSHPGDDSSEQTVGHRHDKKSFPGEGVVASQFDLVDIYLRGTSRWRTSLEDPTLCKWPKFLDPALPKDESSECIIVFCIGSKMSESSLCRGRSLCSPDPYLQLLTSLQKRDLIKFLAVLNRPNIELDHWYDYPHYSTCLDIACQEPDCEQFVDALLKHGVDPNKINRDRKKAPIHFAAESGNRAVIKKLLEFPETNVNALDDYGNTALHICAKHLTSEPGVYDACIFVLMAKPNCQLNIVNIKGYTPLHLAVVNGSKNTIKQILNNSSQPLNIDTFKISSGKSTRDVIMEKFPELEDELPQVTVVDIEDVKASTLFSYLYDNNCNSFVEMFREKIDCAFREGLLNSSDGSCTFLQLACGKGYTEVVKVLLELGADPHLTIPTNTRSPASIASYHGYNDILECFFSRVSSWPTNGGDSILHDVVKGSTSKLPLCARENRDHEKCLSLILYHLDDISVDINQQDKIGNTALHYAAYNDDEYAILMLLKYGAYIGLRNRFEEPPLANITPETLEKFLDTCLETNGELSREENFEIRFKFSFLTPPITTYSHGKSSLDSLVIPVDDVNAKTKPEIPETDPLLYIITAVILFSSLVEGRTRQPLAAISILVSWAELVLLIGRHPLLSTNIEMLKRVSWNFLKFLAWYSILIVAFALSFYTLFRDCSGSVCQNSEDNFFMDPGMSVFKTVVMLTGEFDASSIPFVSFPGTSHVVFMLFVFLIAIVLFNLLNGLAVSDTQAIKNDAELLRKTKVNSCSFCRGCQALDPEILRAAMDILACKKKISLKDIKEVLDENHSQLKSVHEQLTVSQKRLDDYSPRFDDLDMSWKRTEEKLNLLLHKKVLGTPHQNPNLPIIASPLCCESDARQWSISRQISVARRVLSERKLSRDSYSADYAGSTQTSSRTHFRHMAREKGSRMREVMKGNMGRDGEEEKMKREEDGKKATIRNTGERRWNYMILSHEAARKGGEGQERNLKEKRNCAYSQQVSQSRAGLDVDASGSRETGSHHNISHHCSLSCLGGSGSSELVWTKPRIHDWMKTLLLVLLSAQHTPSKKKLPFTITPEPALREKQCYLYVAVPPFSPTLPITQLFCKILVGKRAFLMARMVAQLMLSSLFWKGWTGGRGGLHSDILPNPSFIQCKHSPFVLPRLLAGNNTKESPSYEKRTNRLCLLQASCGYDQTRDRIRSVSLQVGLADATVVSVGECDRRPPFELVSPSLRIPALSSLPMRLRATRISSVAKFTVLSGH
uniref:Ion transport domain-containing protein n=1 Tax=Timema douglasi TaxID=61478 RepID=A0A7R8VDV1_TIMDO|nr:unnamed protein product [Timema douglasi]